MVAVLFVFDCISPLGVIEEDLLDQRVSGDEQIGAALAGQESAVRAGPFAAIHRNLRNGESCGSAAN